MLANYSALFAVLAFPGGLFALAIGLALKGADRRLAARLQRRVGPPLAQPFFDLVKLARKRTMVPDIAAKPVFLGAPLIGAASMLLAAALVPIAGVYTPDPALGDLLVLLYLLTVPAVVLMVSGSASGSPFGAIGFSREMALMLAYEGPLVLVVAAVAMRTGAGMGARVSFSLSEIVAYQQAHGAFLFDPMLWPALLAFLAFYPANLGIVPFDIPEAETEVLEGPLLEYSGPALGLFKVMSALKAVVVLSLGIALFFPMAPAGLAGLAVQLAKLLLLMLLGVTVLRVSCGRMRIDQAFRFFLKWPLALSLLSLVIVSFA
ncbi:respiratory chain complex I subunit 1 family protein [Paludibacterium yongneupense]|uniref:respiratory chain complex I subunit 1 family protein n=1 Tax=Paludibacterium yongneupense TaxID=400061 RepID=UPI00042A2BB2|nr:complex I subunit 1 family protein [Paludibacterium yongneupense]